MGHADRLNSTGDAQYNLKLSQDRMEIIRRHMTQAGIADASISTTYRADSEPVQICDAQKFRSAVEMQVWRIG